MTSSAPPRSTRCLTSESALQGLISAAYGRSFRVECGDGRTRDCVTRGKRTDYTCGDEVTIAAQGGDQGVITGCAPRTSLLYRSDQWKQKLIAANVSQALIVVAPVPSFDLEVLDCCLAAVAHAGIRPLIVLNKSDLPQSAKSLTALNPYTALGVQLLPLTARDSVDALRPLLAGQRSVLVGESGMGKSTILNSLLPRAEAHTREVSAALGTGKHTTTHARLYHLDERSELIDTPGVQAFGVHHLGVGELAAAFIEFRPLLGQCRFRDCRHLNEPGCALDEAQAAGHITPRRLAVYRRLAEAHQRNARPDWA
jgi:ribosome biogenesis GTPase